MKTIIVISVLAVILLAGGIFFYTDIIPTGVQECVEEDVNVILALDMSGSITDNDLIKIKEASKAFAIQILANPKNKVGVVFFGTIVEDKHELTNDYSDIRNFIDNHIPSRSLTCLSCAVKESNSMLSGINPNNRVILMTDGDPNRCTTGACVEAVAREEAKTLSSEGFQQKGIQYFTVRYESNIGQATIDLLIDIAGLTNGNYYTASQVDIVELYQDLANQFCQDICDTQLPNYCIIGDKKCGLSGNVEICVDSDSDSCGDAYQHDSSCPAGQECNDGNCQCPSQVCTENVDRRCIGEGYQICKKYGELCPDWGSETLKGAIEPCGAGETCTNGLCDCPSPEYPLGHTICVGSNTATREYNAVGNECAKWQPAVDCIGGRECKQITTSFAECRCPETSNIELVTTRCYDSNSQQLWGSWVTGECPTWGDPENCGTGKVCQNDECQCITDCPHYDTICSENKVWECQPAGECWDWALIQTCMADEICLKQSPASCYKFFEEITIVTEEEYSYDEPIQASVIVNTQIPDLTGVKIYPQLIGDGKIIDSLAEPLILFGNQASFTFDSIDKTYGEVKIKVRLTKDSAEQTEEKVIHLKNKLQLALSNTPPNYINDNVEILVSVIPAGVDYTLEDIVINDPQGVPISPTSVTISKILFQPSVIGTYQVSAKATASNYITDEDSLPITVNTKSVSFEFYLDGQDITTIEGGYVDAGRHTFTIKSFVSGGTPYDIDKIDIEMIPPEGEQFSEVVHFVKQTTGVYKSELNFKLEERDYSLDGFLQIFGDAQVDPVNFDLGRNIRFKTVGGGDPIIPDLDWTYILWGAGILAVLVTAGILMFRKKR